MPKRKFILSTSVRQTFREMRPNIYWDLIKWVVFSLIIGSGTAYLAGLSPLGFLGILVVIALTLGLIVFLWRWLRASDVAEEGTTKLLYKKERLQELIAQRESLFAKGYAPVSDVTLFDTSYHPRVKQFLSEYFDEEYAQRYEASRDVSVLREVLLEVIEKLDER